jgi:RNA polymerase sigma-70 factor (ECF subfamily)
MDSDQLMLDIRNGKVDSFKQFFESFYPSLCLFANKYLSDSDASHDIVQDAFVYIWNKREDILSIDSTKAYLFKFVKNRSLNYLRDRKKFFFNYEEIENEFFFRDNLIEEETYHQIYKAIRNLPPKGQKVIELSLDGLKNQEIAEELNISVNTVKTIKLRAFKTMRYELKENIFVLYILLRHALRE